MYEHFCVSLMYMYNVRVSDGEVSVNVQGERAGLLHMAECTMHR